MNDEKFCRSCNEKQTCSEIYRKIGSARGPSFIREVLTAFLLPIAVFVASFAAFDAIWAEIIESKKIRTVLDFVMALSATFALVVIIKTVRQSAAKAPKEK
jgi:hypothetical protein